MIVIDASVWVSVILLADVHQREARLWANLMALNQVELAVPAHFPAEVIGVLRRASTSESIIQEAIETIAGGDPFTVHPISVGLGLLSADAARLTTVRGADAVYLALAAWLDVPLVSWDRQQRERGKLFCRTLTPVEALDWQADGSRFL